jgi:CheY-like chemotaxis protein
MVKGRILVVEDEKIVAMGIQMMLKSLGYTITGIISSGDNAVSKVESTFPDLVLIDIMLKGELDGIEVSKEIITKFGIPVIYITACPNSKKLERTWNSGHCGFIVKPFDEMDLKKGIETALYRQKKEKKNLEKELCSR